MTISNEGLAALIREVGLAVEKSGPATIKETIQPLREHVQPGCHIGRGNEMDHTDEGYRLQMEWYAGQLLSKVDNKQFLGINSWINCTEKFTTRKEQA